LRYPRRGEPAHKRGVLAHDAVREHPLLVRAPRGVVHLGGTHVRRAPTRPRVVDVRLHARGECAQGADVRLREHEVGRACGERGVGGREAVGEVAEREGELGGLGRGRMRRGVRVRAQDGALGTGRGVLALEGARAGERVGRVVRVPLELGGGCVRFALDVCVSVGVWEDGGRRTWAFASAARGGRQVGAGPASPSWAS
jgi:hypothetical protein